MQLSREWLYGCIYRIFDENSIEAHEDIFEYFVGACENSVRDCMSFLNVILVVARFSLFYAIPIYFLWNWLVLAIFAIKPATFWQVWGVNYLILWLVWEVVYSRNYFLKTYYFGDRD